jgi:hypothetical protein
MRDAPAYGAGDDAGNRSDLGPLFLQQGEQFLNAIARIPQVLGQALLFLGGNPGKRGLNAAKAGGDIVNVVEKADELSRSGHENLLPVPPK